MSYYLKPETLVRTKLVSGQIRKFLVVNVESSSSSYPAIVASAMLWLMERPDDLRIWPEENSMIPAGTMQHLNPEGGVAPYSFALDPSTAGMGTLTTYADGGTSLEAGPTEGIIRVRVTDATGASLVRSFQITAGLSLSLSGPSSISEGSCSQYTLSLPTGLPAGTVSIDWAIYLSGSDCFLERNSVTDIATAAGEASRQFWIRPLVGSGSRQINAEFSGAVVAPAKFAISVSTAFADGIEIRSLGGSNNFAGNTCISLRVNATNAGFPAKFEFDTTLSLTISGAFGHDLYPSYDCSGAVMSAPLFIPAGGYGSVFSLRMGASAGGASPQIDATDGYTATFPFTFVIPDPCTGTPAIGTICSSGAVFAGQFGGGNYMVMPSGCSDIPPGSVSGGSGLSSYASFDFTPTCTWSIDTLVKSWNNGSVDAYDFPGVENVTIATQPSSIFGSVNQATIAVNINPFQGGFHAAARYCDKLAYGGFTDWYLPSKSELAYLYCHAQPAGTHNASYPQENPNCMAYGGKTSALSGFASDFYWSSTELNNIYGWIQDFSNGNQSYNGKNIGYQVRCVRKF